MAENATKPNEVAWSTQLENALFVKGVGSSEVQGSPMFLNAIVASPEARAQIQTILDGKSLSHNKEEEVIKTILSMLD